MKPLSKKHIAFIDALFVNKFNATQAYQEIYQPQKRETSAVNGTRLLRDERVKAEIKARMSDKGLSAEAALVQLAEIIRAANVADCLKWEGGRLALNPDKAFMVKRIVYRVKNTKRVKSAAIEIEFYSVLEALELILKAHGLL